jgi:hypothetical protein
VFSSKESLLRKRIGHATFLPTLGNKKMRMKVKILYDIFFESYWDQKSLEVLF